MFYPLNYGDLSPTFLPAPPPSGKPASFHPPLPLESSAPSAFPPPRLLPRLTSLHSPVPP